MARLPIPDSQILPILRAVNRDGAWTETRRHAMIRIEKVDPGVRYTVRSGAITRSARTAQVYEAVAEINAFILDRAARARSQKMGRPARAATHAAGGPHV